MVHGIGRGKVFAMIIVERADKQDMANREVLVTVLADRWGVVIKKIRMGQVGMAKAKSGNSNVLFAIMTMHWG